MDGSGENKVDPDTDRGGGISVAVATGLPLLILYLVTASRDLGTIDSGELAAVCARLGIAHPTGYPLYTLLGRVFVLAWPGPPVFAATLLSVVAAAAAALVAASLAREALDPMLRPAVSRWLAAGAALWLGTNRIFWQQATGNEVYALHMLFAAALLLLGRRLLLPGDRARTLLLLAWVAGLALAHHLSVAFLIPALIWSVVLYLSRSGLLRRRTGQRSDGPVEGPRILALAALLALLAWSIQLYLPIRSLKDPALDWGDPTDWHRFWRHALAGQYRVWLFESGRLWWTNLGTYLASLPHRFCWPAVVLVIPGSAALVRRDRSLAIYFGLVFLTTVAWAASYSIHDLDPYFLPADLVLAILGAAGAGALAGMLRLPRVRLRGWAVAALVLVISAWQVTAHLEAADRRADRFVRTHAETLLRGLPPDAILLSRHWDGLVSASIYLQQIEGLRTDVTVVDPELLRRSWYYAQLRRRDPELLAPMEDRVAAFLRQAELFESGRSYDAGVIQSAYLSVIDGIAQLHRPRRPTCFTPDVDPTFLRQAAPVPEGLVFVLRGNPAGSPPLSPPDVAALRAAGYRAEDPIHRQIVEEWARLIESRVRFLQANGRKEEEGAWAAALAGVREMPRQGQAP